jgi:hypothetical protein
MKMIGIFAALAVSTFAFLPASAHSTRVKIRIQTPVCDGICTTGGTLGAASATNGTNAGDAAATASSWEKSKSWLSVAADGAVEAAVKVKSNQTGSATGDGATVVVGGMTAVGSGGN